MHQATAIVAILQISVTVIGFLAVGIVLKLFGYPDATVLEWSPMAVFLREYGLAFLAFPLVWCIYAVSADNVDSRWLSPTIAAIFGIAFIFIIGGLFLVAATYPYTHRHVPYSSVDRIGPQPTSERRIRSLGTITLHALGNREKHVLDDIRRVAGLQTTLPRPSIG